MWRGKFWVIFPPKCPTFHYSLFRWIRKRESGELRCGAEIFGLYSNRSVQLYMTLSSDGRLKTLVELWRLNRTWRNTLREYIFLSKNVRNVAMYHQNKFQVCISKNNECRAKKRRLTIYLNMRSEQRDRQTDRQTDM